MEKVQKRATKMTKEISKMEYGQRLVRLNLYKLDRRQSIGQMIKTIENNHRS